MFCQPWKAEVILSHRAQQSWLIKYAMGAKKFNELFDYDVWRQHNEMAGPPRKYNEALRVSEEHMDEPGTPRAADEKQTRYARKQLKAHEPPSSAVPTYNTDADAPAPLSTSTSKCTANV